MLPEKGESLLKMVKLPKIKEEIRADMVFQIYLVILTS
jgi:hypothetical protein